MCLTYVPIAQCCKQRCGGLAHIAPEGQRNGIAWRELEVETKNTRDSSLREDLGTKELERNAPSMEQLRGGLKKLSKSESTLCSI